jgi:hypothetical protein
MIPDGQTENVDCYTYCLIIVVFFIKRNCTEIVNIFVLINGKYEAAGRDTGITSIVIFTILVLPVL